MANGDVDLTFFARQYERIIAELGILLDELRVNTAMATRLESAQSPMLEQMRALQSLIQRLDERLRKLETDGMSPEQVDAIANRLQPRLLGALSELITQFRHIQGQLKELRELYGTLGGEPFAKRGNPRGN